MSVIYDTAAQMKLDPQQFHFMLEVASDSSYLDIDKSTFELITENPYSYRINGKSVISSYVLDRLTPEKLSEGYAAALTAYARAQVAVGDDKGAVETLLKVTDQRPWLGATWVELADCYERMGDLPRAVHALRQAEEGFNMDKAAVRERRLRLVDRARSTSPR